MVGKLNFFYKFARPNPASVFKGGSDGMENKCKSFFNSKI